MIKSYTVGGNLMNYYEPLLLTPGPTPVPKEINHALGFTYGWSPFTRF